MNKYLELWTDIKKIYRRRTSDDIKKIQSKTLTVFSAQPTTREHDYQDDGFRIPFQRDRDRILWSHSLKRLANKCQVFPVGSDDHIRRRLTHSIEVMQLASTISNSFGLDRSLTEAGAFAHDIGHTPFGHAGESALNASLNDINPIFGGFNHYEHGVDVTRYLEDVYLSPASGGIHGLNLTFETLECILKHTYHREDNPLGQKELIESSKHKDILQDETCHLEGQAIRISDKISYLISDLEDGISMGVFDVDNIMKCRFFHRPPIDMRPYKGKDLYEHFISQRRAILKVIMEDILVETDRKLSKLKDLKDARKEREFTVDFSPTLKSEIVEIWNNLQKGILHKDTRVIKSNMNSAKIISKLLILYTVYTQLVEKRFLESHNELLKTKYWNFYFDKIRRDKVGISKEKLSPFFFEKMIGVKLEEDGSNYLLGLWNLITSKDYVASLTDTSATSEYQTHFGLTET